MISNGEGTGGDSTAGNETTSYNGGGRLKDYSAKFAVSPSNLGDSLKGFKVNALFHKGSKNESTLRNRIFAGLSYESKYVNAVCNYFNADNGSGAGHREARIFNLFCGHSR